MPNYCKPITFTAKVRIGKFIKENKRLPTKEEEIKIINDAFDFVWANNSVYGIVPRNLKFN